MLCVLNHREVRGAFYIRDGELLWTMEAGGCHDWD